MPTLIHHTPTGMRIAFFLHGQFRGSAPGTPVFQGPAFACRPSVTVIPGRSRLVVGGLPGLATVVDKIPLEGALPSVMSFPFSSRFRHPFPVGGTRTPLFDILLS
ncbi:MAG TPA: hypothetical protein DEB39_11055 [Planctomycetaceae bacterium]|nr:hypothetical protein [Planctomycetaceae bacterium]